MIGRPGDDVDEGPATRDTTREEAEMRAGKKATMADVAERAGVSRQTVSNVLNTPAKVLPDTRARVEAVIAELGYQLNSAARQLRTQRSFVVGMCVPPAAGGISGQVLDRFLHALTAKAQESGLRVMLFTAADDSAQIDQYGRLLSTKSVDGFVLTDSHPDDARVVWLDEHHVPFVSFGRPWASDGDTERPAASRHAWVDVDGRAGARDVTERLMAAGHKRIVFLGWPLGSGVGDDRYAGYAAAMDAAGLDAVVVRATEGVSEGAGAAAQALDDPEVTALVAVSDALALGALSAAREMALTAPERPQVAVTGFDNSPVAAAVDLTSVDQRTEEVASAAIDLLLPQLAPGAQVPDRTARPAAMHDADRHVLIQPRLVERASSRTDR
ncbi:LacI family transcriptional regulator [Xylanimonas ulmi]|uniref:LacI family transcriptional regulator n=2 Tax=Xylanimonas ulmi TaxID=228973 RepID=A0A4Q7LZ45_9MICO|nr:LacI family transcriptional regulator [Xylanibacterium ulmi]